MRGFRKIRPVIGYPVFCQRGESREGRLDTLACPILFLVGFLPPFCPKTERKPPEAKLSVDENASIRRWNECEGTAGYY